MREPDVVGAAEVLLETGRVAVGHFRCSPENARFRDTGPTQRHLVVFPRTAVEIIHAGKAPIVADPTRAMLYNRGQEYRRGRLAPEGDRCDWFGFEGRDVAEAVAHAARRPPLDEDRPLPVSSAPVDAGLYLLQRRIFEEARAPDPDLLVVEEGALTILGAALFNALGAAGEPSSAGADLERDERVAAVQSTLSSRYRARHTLSGLARIAGCSPFHLMRIFRSRTGMTVHRYLTELRLRGALERLEPATDLSALALELGFSSHSHFTSAFRSTFGLTPSAVRRASRWSPR